MTKKLWVSVLALVIVGSMLFLGCKSASVAEPEEEIVEEAEVGYILAEDIVAPPGKTLYVLPIDQVAEEPIRMAVVCVMNNPFCMALVEGADFAEKVLTDRNCSVDWISVDSFDPKKFEDSVQSCITAQYDAIILFGLSEALQPVVDRAVDEGILVNTFNTEPGMESKRNAFWGQDGFTGGQKCGGLLEEAMGGEGKYAIITGSFNVLGHELRRTGARDILDKNSKLELIGEFENQDKAEEAYNVTQNLITANPDIKGIYVTAGGPFGAAKAIQDLKLTGEVKLVCHDWMEETIAYIRSGEVTACLDQDPFNQNYAPIVSAFNQLVGGIIPDEFNWFEGDVATPDNVAEKIPE